MEENYFERGYEKLKTHDYQGAIEDFTKDLEIYPDTKIIYILRGYSKYQMACFNHDVYEVKKRLFQSAIYDYSKAIEIEPQDHKAYCRRGEAKQELEDYQGAYEDYNIALEIKPNNAEIYNKRGLAKYYLGDNEGAKSDINKAIGLDPKLESAYLNRGHLKAKLMDYTGAIEDYNKSKEIKPKNMAASLSIFMAQNKLDKGKVKQPGAIKTKLSQQYLDFKNRNSSKQIIESNSKVKLFKIRKNSMKLIKKWPSIFFEKIENWVSKLSKQQKIVVAIAVPLLLLIITLPIAESVYFNSTYESGQYFGLNVNWWVWLIFVAIVGVVEFKLFDQKKND